MATSQKKLTGRKKVNDRHLLADDDSGRMIILDRSTDSVDIELAPSAVNFRYGSYAKDGMNSSYRFDDYNTYLNNAINNFKSYSTWASGFCADSTANLWLIPLISNAGPGMNPTKEGANCIPGAGWFAMSGVAQKYTLADKCPAALCKATKIQIKTSCTSWCLIDWYGGRPNLLRPCSGDYFSGRQPIMHYYISSERTAPNSLLTKSQGSVGIKSAAIATWEAKSSKGDWSNPVDFIQDWTTLDVFNLNPAYTKGSNAYEQDGRWSQITAYNNVYWHEVSATALTAATNSLGELWLHAWLYFPQFENDSSRWLLDNIRTFASVMVEGIKVTVAWAV